MTVGQNVDTLFSLWLSASATSSTSVSMIGKNWIAKKCGLFPPKSSNIHYMV